MENTMTPQEHHFITSVRERMSRMANQNGEVWLHRKDILGMVETAFHQGRNEGICEFRQKCTCGCEDVPEDAEQEAEGTESPESGETEEAPSQDAEDTESESEEEPEPKKK